MLKRTIFILGAAFILSCASFFSIKAWDNYRQAQIEFQKRRISWMVLREQVRRQCSEFGGRTGIIIKDLDTGWQMGINEGEAFPSASLAKVPVMTACFLAEQDGRMKLDEVLTLKGKDMVLGSGILKAYRPGARFKVRDLVRLMISESDNTAANMLIERLGVDYINGCFLRVGLKNTNLSRKMMDFKSRRKGKENYTTAGDIVYILDKIYNGTLISPDYSRLALGFLQEQKINDRIPARLPSGLPVAHKTGLENGICHDAGIVFSPEGDFLICVLTRHNQKTARVAKKFIAELAFLTYGYTAHHAYSAPLLKTAMAQE